jgi:cytochrome P450
LPLWLPSPVNRRIGRVRAALDSHIAPRIAQRLECQENDGRDLLDDLRAARAPGTGESMTFTELLEETKTLFVTGYETTAVSLAWALYLLGTHPEAARGWHEEADRVLPGEAVPESLSVADFPYTAAVVNEAMRLYPAAYNVGRECHADTDIVGYRFRKGDTALISIFGIHRNPAFWDDPESFRPARFLADGGGGEAFMPFASGGHFCIGAHFAVMEMVSVLALIGRRFRLRALNTAPPRIVARVTLGPAEALPIALEARRRVVARSCSIRPMPRN